MTTMPDAGLERALDELPDGSGPREGWQDCVLARVEVPPAPRRVRWPFWVAGSSLVAAAAAAVLFIGLRSPEQEAPEVRPVQDGAALQRLQGEIDRLSVLKEHAAEKILRAMTEAERAQAIEQLEAVQESLRGLRSKVRKRSGGGKIVAKCEPNDPLCGLD